jgi:hypothetical protein
MNTPLISEVPAEPKPGPAAAADHNSETHPRPIRKWVGLSDALALLEQARALAVEDQIDGEGGGK